jgi:carbonic anhydrase/acetyltransferase-like protein (isoleucine patch superfamily)
MMIFTQADIDAVVSGTAVGARPVFDANLFVGQYLILPDNARFTSNVRFCGYNVTIGSNSEFICNAKFDSYTIIKPHCLFHGNVTIGDCSTIEHSCNFRFSTHIGSRVNIGDSNQFDTLTVGNSVDIGAGTTVNCLVAGKHVELRHGVTIRSHYDLLIGTGSTFESGFTIAGHEVQSGRRSVITFGGGGRIGQMVHFFRLANGEILVITGCFIGTLQEFRDKVNQDTSEVFNGLEDPGTFKKHGQYMGMANVAALSFDRKDLIIG